MNRRILLQVSAPAVIIGLLLFGTCLFGIWYIHQLEADLARIIQRNVKSLTAAQQLEISVRQLRHHNFLYLIDRKPRHLQQIIEDHAKFERFLVDVKETTPGDEEAVGYVAQIEGAYRDYHDWLDRLRAQTVTVPAAFLGEQEDTHPIKDVVNPCLRLLEHEQKRMENTYLQTEAVGREAQGIMLLLGVLGPAGGMIAGFGIARGLSRSIYQLSVRVQDMAHRLDQHVASVSIAADGDLRNLDKQLSHVVLRVEEVAERLQRHQRDMLRAEQLSAVGQLAASVAHEVRNPLTSVKMLVEVALRSQNRKPLTLNDLQVIHGEVARLEQTVQNFLDFARPPTPQRSRCDLREVVDQAAELVQARARQQQVELAVHRPDAEVPADVDRGQLRTVLVNLFLNALDAMPCGGRLVVELERSPAQGIELRVSDTGGGITPEIANRLFTPFTSTKPTGTGLGLSISRRIVEEHGGSLTAGNRPDGGACFVLSLSQPCDVVPDSAWLGGPRMGHSCPACWLSTTRRASATRSAASSRATTCRS
jgi:signal transduction histidine kinase